MLQLFGGVPAARRGSCQLYRTIKRPFVQGRLADRISALDAAVAKILDMRRPARMTSWSPGLRRRLPAQGRRHRQAVHDVERPHLKMDFAFTPLDDGHGWIPFLTLSRLTYIPPWKPGC